LDLFVVVFKAKVTEFPLFIVKVIALGPLVPARFHLCL
jgi:hypothetical protein